jgi:Protein of unknown function (DUF4232)
MNPPLSRFTPIALASSLLLTIPILQSCAHSTRASTLKNGAPIMLHEDGPHARGGTNPNAPYLVAASRPQLVKRSEDTQTTAAGPCDSKDLAVTEIAAAVNGNYRAVKLAFANEGLVPCRIGGYPSITLLDKTGTPVTNLVVDRVTTSTLQARLSDGPVQTAAAKPDAQITIAPKGEAWFQVGWSTGPECPVVSRISVNAPGSSESFSVNHPLTICEGRVQITTLHSDQDSD